MPRFWVTYKIDARFVAEVEVEDATDIKTALHKGLDKYYDADFGDASDIDAEPIIIEDEDNNFIWEKQ